MKRILALFLAIVICLSMAGCSASESEINEFLNNLGSTSYFNADSSAKTLKKCVKSESFADILDFHIAQLLEKGSYKDAVMLFARLIELDYEVDAHAAKADAQIFGQLETNMNNGDYDAAYKALKELSDYGYQSESLKNAVSVKLAEKRDCVFNSNDISAMIEYIEMVKSYLDGNYYTSIIDCFPYNQMKTFFEENGEPALTRNGEGGYYDDLHEEYEDVSYWYSPLFEKKLRKGEVGTYQVVEDYEFYGDFMTHFHSRYWYQTDRSDSNNSFDRSLYYKGTHIGNDRNINIDLIVGQNNPDFDKDYFLATTGLDWEDAALYSFETDGDVLLVVVGTANIHIIHNGQMVTVAYE